MRYLKAAPLYQERVWGGRSLEKALGRSLPGEKPIGESWELVDRPEADSFFPEQGLSLSQLRAERAEWLLGPGWPSDRPFPILVKWLDCEQRLSLQVHPPAGVAPKLGGEPKTENWYIVEATPEAALLVGLKPGVTPEEFRTAIAKEEVEERVQRLPSRPGDSLFVPSGRLHAIDAGNLILEIQQNSDTTYRVYDWGRKGLDGQPRQLHVEESMQSINFSDTAPEMIHAGEKEAVLADAEEFRLRRRSFQPGESMAFSAGEEARILSVVEGSLANGDGFRARRGDNLLLPYGEVTNWEAREPSVVLITDHFFQPGKKGRK
ncbi:MAG: mannose-6-phosphate isomerase [Verrucomicrobia bacterium]|jgi:mannose-6-phosphate isomerase|nr:mannose-6-phosphate isomerase [Verrucomicrobiota bacterium]